MVLGLEKVTSYGKTSPHLLQRTIDNTKNIMLISLLIKKTTKVCVLIDNVTLMTIWMYHVFHNTGLTVLY